MKLQQIYFVAFLIGAAVPLYFIFRFLSESGLDIVLFVQQIFVNNPAATFSSDLLIVSFIFWLFMYCDETSNKIPNKIWFVILNLSVGLSAAFPLYLYFKEKAKNQSLPTEDIQ